MIVLKVKQGDWYGPIQEDLLKDSNFIITVKKTRRGLFWSDGYKIIKNEYISEVISGDISEYLL